MDNTQSNGTLRGPKVERYATIISCAVFIGNFLFYASTFRTPTPIIVESVQLENIPLATGEKLASPPSLRHHQKVVNEEPDYFDPNTVSTEKLQAWGISKKTSHTIEKYRKNGGVFYKPSDFEKIYGLRKEDYQRLLPFIRIQQSYREKQTKSSYQKEDYPTAKLFEFDPNTIEAEGWKKLGLSATLAKRIVKFRSKGGKFYNPADLQKIYGLDKATYERLFPFIKIAQKQSEKPPKFVRSHPYQPKSIDINQSTIDDWKQLPGIGDGYARRILNFRDKLGGFVSVAQVSDTYHLPDSVFQKIKPLLNASPIQKKIAINSVTMEELKSHPYLNYKQAKAIVNYRKNHGNYQSLNDLKKVKGVLTMEVVERISPYLSLE